MSLILCPECSRTISDKAISCPGCGYPMTISEVLLHNEKQISVISAPSNSPHTKHPKLPNGYGSIKKLSGKRSRPYAVYPPTKNSQTNPFDIRTPALGYYADWFTAFNALNAYHHNSYNNTAKSLTFYDVYKQFYADKFQNGHTTLSDSSKYAYETAFQNCPSLHSLHFSDIRKPEMQKILDECPLGYSSICNLKKLFSQMYKYAMENDLVEKNYAQFVTIRQPDNNEKGEPFSPEELQLLWKNTNNPTVQMILIMIYSGYRIKAFESIEINPTDLFFRGGVKTLAGKGRIVPIHPCIRSFSLDFKKMFPSFQARNFRSSCFYPTLEKLGIAYTKNNKKHTPHDCRHTFSWRCDKYKVDELSKHLLMGHSLGKDIEKSVYGHRTLDELREEISKIQV